MSSSMPEKGWSILTVREDTARRVKELAHSKGLTVDEFINELMSPSGVFGWSTCGICGAKAQFFSSSGHRPVNITVAWTMSSKD